MNEPKFVKFNDVLDHWMAESLAPFMRTLDLESPAGIEFYQAFQNAWSSLTEAAIPHGRPPYRTGEFYADVSSSFTIKEIWEHLILASDNKHLQVAINAICDAAKKLDESQPAKLRDGFEVACAQVRAYDVTTKDGSIADFSTAYQERNPFRVRDLRRFPAENGPS